MSDLLKKLHGVHESILPDNIQTLADKIHQDLSASAGNTSYRYDGGGIKVKIGDIQDTDSETTYGAITVTLNRKELGLDPTKEQMQAIVDNIFGTHPGMQVYGGNIQDLRVDKDIIQLEVNDVTVPM